MDLWAAEGRAGWKIKVELEAFDWQRLRVGWLRAGYLAAFAFFGYRFRSATFSESGERASHLSRSSRTR